MNLPLRNKEFANLARRRERPILSHFNLILSGIFIVQVTSCAPPRGEQKPSSKVNFAHSEGWDGQTMLSVPPGSTLYICDKGAGPTAVKDIIRSVKEWAAAGGMDAHLNVAEGCGNKSEITTMIGGCEVDWAAAVTSHWGAPGQWKINYCSQSYTDNYDITLHEVGHVYGQCDRYGKGGLGHPVRGVNCSDAGRGSDGQYSLASAMQAGGPSHPHKVTEDDQNGLKALIARNDIRGSQAWRGVIGKPGTAPQTPSPQTNAPAGNNTAPDQTLPPSDGNAGSSPCKNILNQLGQIVPLLEECGDDGICKLIRSSLCGGSAQ